MAASLNAIRATMRASRSASDMRPTISASSLLATVHQLLDEGPPLAGQGEHALSSVGGELAAIDEPGRDQPVTGAAGVGRVDAQPLGDG